jgi:hypothetical protein
MLRARPAAACVWLNHILIKGFFFSQGFAIILLASVFGRLRPGRLLSSTLFTKSPVWRRLLGPRRELRGSLVDNSQDAIRVQIDDDAVTLDESVTHGTRANSDRRIGHDLAGHDNTP